MVNALFHCQIINIDNGYSAEMFNELHIQLSPLPGKDLLLMLCERGTMVLISEC